MPSLLDIAPPEITAETVDIRGTKLTVSGVGADGWATLYARHPILRAIVVGRMEELSSLEALRAHCAVIAAGLGSPGNAKIERAVLVNLTEDEQKDLLRRVMRLSMPGNIAGPLLDAGADGDAPGEPGKVPDTK